MPVDRLAQIAVRTDDVPTHSNTLSAVEVTAEVFAPIKPTIVLRGI